MADKVKKIDLQPKEEKQKQTTSFIPASSVRDKDGFEIHFFLPGTAAATAANYSTFYTVDRNCVLGRVRVSFAAASTSGTLQIERLSGTEAPGSGDNILRSTFDLSATANTVYTKKFATELTNNTLLPGDRLAFVDGGTLTNLTNLAVTLYLYPKNKGHYEIYA